MPGLTNFQQCSSAIFAVISAAVSAILCSSEAQSTQPERRDGRAQLFDGRVVGQNGALAAAADGQPRCSQR